MSGETITSIDATGSSEQTANIVTSVPGPKSASVLARKDTVCPDAFSIHLPAVVAHASGACFTDIDGNTFIDWIGGVGCLNVGHSNPRVVKAINEQVSRFTHTDFTVVPYENYVDLAEKLCARAPWSGAAKAAFFNSGAEAVENAVKIARVATGRTGIICFAGGFHGRTLMAMSLTSKTHPYKAGFGPFAPEVYRAPFPYPLRQGGEDQSSALALAELRRMFETHVAAETVAAIIVEPVLGEGGFLVPPKSFMAGLREIADEHGILLVHDEVQSGMGRTGKLWATSHFGTEPDLLLTAKSIAMGMPLSGVIGRAEVMDKVPDSGIGGTYVGNPVAIAAALAVLEELEEGGLIERGAVVGEQLQRRFSEYVASDDGIVEERGLGPMRAMEFVHPQDGSPDRDRVARVVDAAAARGLALLKAGIDGNCIRVLVPLCISDRQLEDAFLILENALAETRN